MAVLNSLLVQQLLKHGPGSAAAPPAGSLLEKNSPEVGDGAQLVEWWPSTHQALGSILALHKLDVVAPNCNPSTWEVEAEGSEVQGRCLLHRKVKTNGQH